ncbi:class I SAM-dependent methyltransferase [Streptomyces thermospinosisporus]|uniref:class I SAM-dependent methyltransferase n=1 Tax=Streptomyces thermospinosisporus TaxID=161482 RepID=UPI0031D17A05
MAEEFAARRVLDIGCGTGVFARLLADRGIEVIGVDPALASLDVARARPGGERVRWIHGDATRLPPLQADLVTMTANVAQAIVEPRSWQQTLRGAREALRPGGHLLGGVRLGLGVEAVALGDRGGVDRAQGVVADLAHHVVRHPVLPHRFHEGVPGDRVELTGLLVPRLLVPRLLVVPRQRLARLLLLLARPSHAGRDAALGQGRFR